MEKKDLDLDLDLDLDNLWVFQRPQHCLGVLSMIIEMGLPESKVFEGLCMALNRFVMGFQLTT